MISYLNGIKDYDASRAPYRYPVIKHRPSGNMFIGPLGSHHSSVFENLGVEDTSYGDENWAAANLWPPHTYPTKGPRALPDWKFDDYTGGWNDLEQNRLLDWAGKNYPIHSQKTSSVKVGSLPYKFIWGDGQLAIGPGWLKNLHHIQLYQDLGIVPHNWVGGTYSEDTFTGQPHIKYDWPATGNVPSEPELIEMIQQHLNQQQQHIGRVSRRPW